MDYFSLAKIILEFRNNLDDLQEDKIYFSAKSNVISIIAFVILA